MAIKTMLGVGCAALALSALGCGADHVPLGDGVTIVNLSDCYGEGTDCGGSQDVPLLDLLEDLPAPCPLEDEPPRAAAWTDLLDAVVLGVAVDGTGVLWIASRATEDGLGPVLVRRYSKDGELLSEVDVEFMIDHDHGRYWQLDLVAHPQGGATLGVQLFVADRATNWQENLWLRVLELDAEGEPASEPLEVAGITGQLNLASGGDGALLVAGGNDEGNWVLGRFTGDGRIDWVQTALHSRFVDAIGAHDGAYVLGARATDTPLEHTASVAFYDARGNLAWDRKPPFSTQFEPIGVDEEGNLTVAGYMEQVDPPQVMLIEIDPEGDASWAAFVPEVQVLRGPISFDAEGTMSFSAEDPEQERNLIYQVSADGSQCSRTEVVIDGVIAGAITYWAAADGTRFFVGEVVDKPLRVVGALQP